MYLLAIANKNNKLRLSNILKENNAIYSKWFIRYNIEKKKS